MDAFVGGRYRTGSLVPLRYIDVIPCFISFSWHIDRTYHYYIHFRCSTDYSVTKWGKSWTGGIRKCDPNCLNMTNLPRQTAQGVRNYVQFQNRYSEGLQNGSLSNCNSSFDQAWGVPGHLRPHHTHTARRWRKTWSSSENPSAKTWTGQALRGWVNEALMCHPSMSSAGLGSADDGAVRCQRGPQIRLFTKMINVHAGHGHVLGKASPQAGR